MVFDTLQCALFLSVTLDAHVQSSPPTSPPRAAAAELTPLETHVRRHLDTREEATLTELLPFLPIAGWRRTRTRRAEAGGLTPLQRFVLVTVVE